MMATVGAVRPGGSLEEPPAKRQCTLGGPAGDLAKTVKTAAEVPSEKAIKKMTARQLLACIDAKKPQELRLQAMQVLAVRAAVAPAKQHEIATAPDAVLHIAALMHHDDPAMRLAAATCLGNLSVHKGLVASAPGALLALVTLLKDADADIRLEAVRALHKITDKNVNNQRKLLAVPGVTQGVEELVNEAKSRRSRFFCHKTASFARKLKRRLQVVPTTEKRQSNKQAKLLQILAHLQQHPLEDESSEC